MRLDQKLSLMFPQYSRSFLNKQIKAGLVSVNQQVVCKSSYIVNVNDQITLKEIPVKSSLEANNIPLDIIYENENYLVINKGKNMVVHPNAHNVHHGKTIVNAILFHCQQNLSQINDVYRPGIVHRLDKDTTGILIVAKNDRFHRHLAKQIEARTVSKIYRALVIGNPNNGVIQAPIGRSLNNRQNMAIRSNGKEALTKFTVLNYHQQLNVSLIEIKLITGRTHQIRVHFKAINHPIIGDTTYGDWHINKWWQQKWQINSQLLHAYQYSFLDLDNEIKTFTAKPVWLLENNAVFYTNLC